MSFLVFPWATSNSTVRSLSNFKKPFRINRVDGWLLLALPVSVYDGEREQKGSAVKQQSGFWVTPHFLSLCDGHLVSLTHFFCCSFNLLKHCQLSPWTALVQSALRFVMDRWTVEAHFVHYSRYNSRDWTGSWCLHPTLLVSQRRHCFSRE